jgi:hypothetical protein
LKGGESDGRIEASSFYLTLNPQIRCKFCIGRLLRKPPSSTDQRDYGILVYFPLVKGFNNDGAEVFPPSFFIVKNIEGVAF